MNFRNGGEGHFMVAWLPNTITLLNLFSGFIALIMITEARFQIAAWLILVSMILDSLDGNVARALKNANLFGRELDSLADVVSFVVTPALLAFKSWTQPWAPWTVAAVFLYLAAGVYRLARFNIRPPVRTYFEGFPTPAAAVLVAMSVAAYQKDAWHGYFPYVLHHGLLLIVISLLMMSQIPYPKLSTIPLSKWQSLIYLQAANFFLVSWIANIETAIASIFLLFLILSPVYCFPLPKSSENSTKNLTVPKAVS